MKHLRFLLLFLPLATPALAAAQEAPALNAGDTAWMIVATALVLFMTLPGLALFYSGLVRAKNALSILMQCFAICSVITLLWVIYGYSLAAAPGNRFFGGFDYLFLKHMSFDTLNGTLPESVWVTFQMTFAIITPALGGSGFGEGILSVGSQVWAQFLSVIVTILWSGVVAALLFFLVDKLVGLRVEDEDELRGLDLAEHDEQAYEI